MNYPGTGYSLNTTWCCDHINAVIRRNGKYSERVILYFPHFKINSRSNKITRIKKIQKSSFIENMSMSLRISFTISQRITKKVTIKRKESAQLLAKWLESSLAQPEKMSLATRDQLESWKSDQHAWAHSQSRSACTNNCSYQDVEISTNNSNNKETITEPSVYQDRYNIHNDMVTPIHISLKAKIGSNMHALQE